MRFLTFVSAFLAIFQVSAQTVQTALSKRRVNIGEPFVVSVSVSGAKDGQVRFPDWKGRGSEVISIKDRIRMDKEDNQILSRDYRLMLLQPGLFTLPPSDVEIARNGTKQVLRTDSVTVYAELLPINQPDLRMEPPVSVGYSRSEWMPYAVGAVVVCVSVLFWLIFRHLQKSRKLIVARNPTRAVLRDLRLLKNKSVSQNPRQTAARLDQLLRDYLTQRFNVPARHLSVAEIIHELRNRNVAEQAIAKVEDSLKGIQSARFSTENTFVSSVEIESLILTELR